MIRFAALLVGVIALLPASPLGCPPTDVTPLPPDLIPTVRNTLNTTAAAPATAIPQQLVTLQASVEPRSDSGVISYSWFQTAGLGVPLLDADQPTASFIAPSLATDQRLRFMVSTLDEAGAVGHAEVTVTVSADPNFGASTTQPAKPTADAGKDQYHLGGEVVTLDGSKSTGRGLTFHWREVSGPAITLDTPDAAQTSFTAQFDPNNTDPAVIELLISDVGGNQVTDRVQVKIGDPSLSDTNVEMVTSKGTITLALDRTAAPVTVGNFLWYIDDKFYDNTIFHRVIPDFVIQGGGYDPDLAPKQTRDPIINEADNGLSNIRGTIAMARASDPDSATSQFFINVKNNVKDGDGQSNLDPGGVTTDGYAVFGHVTAGLDVVDAIDAVTTGTEKGFQDVPLVDVLVTSVRRLPVGG